MEEENYRININPDWIKKYLGRILVGIILLVGIFSGVKTVGPEEEGVVIQLGEFNRTVQPGLNFFV